MMNASGFIEVLEAGLKPFMNTTIPNPRLARERKYQLVENTSRVPRPKSHRKPMARAQRIFKERGQTTDRVRIHSTPASFAQGFYNPG
jgi:hypothetical protein